MKVLSLFLGVCVCAFYVCQTKAHITIQIEPNEIDQIVNILQTMIHQNHNIQHPSVRIRLCQFLIPLAKSSMRCITQMTAIMMTLVGANLITTRLEAPITSFQMTSINSPQSTETPQMYENSYGCASNYCWRTCENENDTIKKNTQQKKWCITMKPNGTSFAAVECVDHHDCSPFWRCLSRCEPIKQV